MPERPVPQPGEFSRPRRLRRGPGVLKSSWLAMLAVAILPSSASAFAFWTVAEGPAGNPRWGWNQGLSDGLAVSVEVGFAADLGAASQAEIDLVNQVVRDAIAAWESPVLGFTVEVEQSGVSEGPTVGFEVDVFAVPGTHPQFAGTGFFSDLPKTPLVVPICGCTVSGVSTPIRRTLSPPSRTIVSPSTTRRTVRRRGVSC